MSHEDSIQYLEELYRLPFVPASSAGLDRASFLLAQVGNPHRSFRSVHVAGSTGKGSTTTMIAEMLRAAGFRTGAFRSPHLRSYTERAAVDGSDISAEEWTRHFDVLYPVAERMRANDFPGYSLGRPTLFELLLAIAALHFEARRIDWAVVETGLGGRLDATNLLQPDVVVITNISLEHTRILGDTLPAIAREKAAIIKRGSDSVTAAHGEALDVIVERARDVHSPLLIVGRDIRVSSEVCEEGQEIHLEAMGTALTAYLPSRALYQAQNAATAFGAAVWLRSREVDVPLAAIRRGLERFSAPGRFEILPGTPTVILDGAHNPDGMGALARSLETPPDVTLFAAMEDKDIEGMASAVKHIVRRVVVTEVPGTARTASLERMVSAFTSIGADATAIVDPQSAMTAALAEADGTMLVTGSLYLVGLARERLTVVTA